MKTVVIILVILCTSCLSRKDENIVNVNNIEEEIYIGMPKKDLIKKIGIPKDSIMSDVFEKDHYYYVYDTNDFTGYTLKIWFNSNNTISKLRVN